MGKIQCSKYELSPEPVPSLPEILSLKSAFWAQSSTSSPDSVIPQKTRNEFITPHAQREQGKVIDRGVHIYILCLWSKKIFESYFRDRLTFSNIDSRTSRRMYRLALLLRAPETLSSLSKSRISIFNAHLTLLVRKMTSHNSIGKYRHLVN